MARKNYSAAFKFKVVLETLNTDRTDAEVGRAYDVHPVTVGSWRKKFLDNGPVVFGGDEALKECQKKVADMERLLGKKEVEIALLKNFLGEN
jgi:transposase